MRRTHALTAAVLIASLAGCGSLGTTGAAGAQPSGRSAAASSAPCTTKACIVTDAEGLTGTVAKDNAVMTRVACKKSTVRPVVSGTYTVHCTVSYSDGMVARGIASVLTGKGDVEWEPTDIISGGS
jgi:hypothetical protein